MSTPESLVGAFAKEHRAHLPALLSAVIMTGSATLDDWRPGISDIDVVMVVTRPLAQDDFPTIRRLHASSKAGAPIDGIYVTEEQLSSGPDSIAAVPQVVGGDFVESLAGGELTWVTWLEIEHGRESVVTDAGAELWTACTRRFAGARERARSFSRENLITYWAPLGTQARTQLSKMSMDAEVNASTVRWIALGPSRLVATIETGAIISKSDAATFASRKWPKYEDLLSRASASREGRDEVFTAGDASLAIELLHECVATVSHSPKTS